MPTVQIWANESDMENLNRLKEFLENEQEKTFKACLIRSSRRGKRKRIRKERINYTHIYRKALNYYWIEREQEIIEFEKNKRHR